MKKFLINLGTYASILCVLTLLINLVYVQLDKRDSDYTAKFKSIPNNIEVCNFGSSHGLFGYNYEDLDDKYTCFNFSLVAQYPSYDYRMMDYYKNNLKDGCIVFINLSYFALIGKSEETTEDFTSKNKRYYKLLDSKHIKQYSLATDFFVEKMPSLDARVDLIRAVSCMLKNDEHSNWAQTADEIDLTNDVNRAYLRHLVTDKLDVNGQSIINEEELDAIYAMIKMCKENNWTPVLITTPLLKEYTDIAWKNSSVSMNTFYDLVHKITNDTNVNYYDYSLDNRFSTHHELFMNGDHLNQEGAKLFVDILDKEVINKTK